MVHNCFSPLKIKMASYTFCIFVFWTCINYGNSAIQSGSFTYRGNVLYSDVSLLISEEKSEDTSLRFCAVECYKNLDCNAIELCSLTTGNVCRLSKGIHTSLVTGAASYTCSRHELEQSCGPKSFYNRRTDRCQCVIDCDCSAVTPPTGGFLTTTIYLDGEMFNTSCINTTGHVWTMIQRRMDGSINFYRGWKEYKIGFGNIQTEFWIGLDNIRLLVMNGYTILRVELEEGSESVYAEYSSFYIADESDKYRIKVSGYSGTAGDSISCTNPLCNNNAQFSTFDNDNDPNPTRNHAVEWRGAWWYQDGHTSNLNGEYGNNNHGQGINWIYFKGWTNSLSGSRIMLRRP